MSQRTSPIWDENASKANAVCVTIAVSLGENAETLLFLAYNIRLITNTD